MNEKTLLDSDVYFPYYKCIDIKSIRYVYIMINMTDDITNKTKTKINLINGLFLKVLIRFNK
jgi:hypothetical protein